MKKIQIFIGKIILMNQIKYDFLKMKKIISCEIILQNKLFKKINMKYSHFR